MNWTEVLAVWFLVSVVASPFVGQWLHNRRVNQEFREHLDSERRRVRLEKLVELADEYEAAQTDKQRSLTFRKATELGFTDGPFMLDEDAQPHLPKAS